MNVTYRHDIKELLKDIEVSDSDYEKAANRYKSISSFVENSMLCSYNPEIFIQGSFKLGTAIKPITSDGAYDIDMVLVINKLTKLDISQCDLKKEVGKVIENYRVQNCLKNEIKDGKRCWTIDYVDDHNFHVDILPSLQNNQTNVLSYTNKNNEFYYTISDLWDVTNPKDYYLWFIKHSNLEYVKKRYAQKMKMEVENIPDYKIKTHLQRIIQIFKRHAEVMFEDELEYKPSSIIITTLCTKAYSKIRVNELYFEDLLKEVAKGLLNELDFSDGKYCVLNPVYQKENLSQKWGNEEYYDYFLKWVDQLIFDLNVMNGITKRKEEFNLLRRSLLKNKDSNMLQKNLDLLPHHKKMVWKDEIWKKVVIKALLVDDNRKSIGMLKSNELVDKGKNIMFIAETEHIDLYNVFWQITNTGLEAQRDKQLRGDFYETEVSRGTKMRVETTSYSGKHYVEAFIVDKNNCCVGKSLPFVVNIK